MAGTAELAPPSAVPSKPITLKDVAEEAGVSTAAVSRSFTPGSPVSKEMRKHVLATADALGYRPNRLAAGLANGKTGLIGLVTDGFESPAVTELLSHMTKLLQDEGFRPLLMNLAGETSADKAISMVQEYAVEALIFLSPTMPLPFIRAFHHSGLTVVQAFDLRNNRPFISQSALQDAVAGRVAANTFNRRGYKKPAYIGGPRSSKAVRDPFPGFQNAAEKHGIEVQRHFAESWGYEAGFEAMEKLLASSECDACFFGNDLLAIGALAWLRQAGKAVPDEFGLIGLDDIPMAGWHDIGLTTIRVPQKDIAQNCVDLMKELREDPSREKEARLVRPELIERGTLRPPGTG